MKFLVDANVLSEATKPTPNPAVLRWLSEHETELATSPIVLGELEYGILTLPAGKRRTRLAKWFADGTGFLRVLEFDASTARAWATLLANLGRKGRAMPIKDSLIAASAIEHGLTVATRNVADFRYSGTRIVNPFTAG